MLPDTLIHQYLFYHQITTEDGQPEMTEIVCKEYFIYIIKYYHKKPLKIAEYKLINFRNKIYRCFCIGS